MRKNAAARPLPPLVTPGAAVLSIPIFPVIHGQLRTHRPKRPHGSPATADELGFDWNFERWVHAFIAQHHPAQRNYIELRVTDWARRRVETYDRMLEPYRSDQTQ